MPVTARDRGRIEPFYGVFGVRIHRARKARGLTQDQLAKLIGRNEGYISDVEAGRLRVPLHAAVALAEVLGVSLADLTKPSPGRARLEALADE